MAILDPVFANKQGQTPQDIERRRRMAQQLLAQSQENERITSPWQGAAKVAQALMGGYEEARANRDDKTNRAAANDLLAKTLLGEDPYSPASSGTSGSPIPMTGAANEVQGPRSASVTPGGNPDVSDYIRQGAIARGMDPNVVLRVAGHEGLNVFDPSKPDQGGDEGSSFGPFQLHYAGRSKSMPNPGLGDEFTKATGLHASDPSTWKQQIDFSLDWARKHGWSPWMGAKAEGITGMMGINGTPPQQPAQVASLDPGVGMPAAAEEMQRTAPASGYVDPRVTTEGRAPMQGPTQPAPQLPPPSIVASAPPVASVPQQPASLMSSPVPGQAPSAPQMMAQTSPSKRAQIAALLQNPYTQEAGQQMLMQEYERQQQAQNLILKQQLEQNDPKYRQDLEKGSIELENLRNPRIGPADEANIDLNRDKFKFEQENSQLTPDIKEYKFAKDNGYTGSFAQYQVDLKKASANNTTINNGEGNKFYNTLDENNAKIFSGLSDAGIQGRSKLGQIDQLENLLNSGGTGAMAVLKQRAGDLGINTEGLSDIQAASAMLSKMIPEQRAPGSGPVSDADLAGFRNSLPRLINQPGGNATIINTMRGLTQYQIDMGTIADRVANREITPAQGREMIANLPNPLSSFKAPPPGQEKEGWTNIPSDVPNAVIRRKN